ncbi:hypothetical protein [Acinetobacter sp. BIGb0102]|uniref:hypothetical protein n=1 Tax=Acinetobacter sp. BIGb0102 TaxID=2485131 RepID=UPI000F50C952|nr:hypothetical protein [Acinetobacter sp. BIGb0102]
MGWQIGKAAISRMVTTKNGTILFLGNSKFTKILSESTASAAAGMRSFAQSMAREFNPKGIHITHISLTWDQQPYNTKAVADMCWQLHQQHKSTWTFEIDLNS